MSNIIEEALESANGDSTLIVSNGSKWAGESPDQIEVFMDRLVAEPLDPMFEKLGFIGRWNPSSNLDGDLSRFVGAKSFSGNFLKISAAFSIITLDDDLADKLTRLIEANMLLPEYVERANELYSDYQIVDVNGIRHGKTPRKLKIF